MKNKKTLLTGGVLGSLATLAVMFRDKVVSTAKTTGSKAAAAARARKK